MSQPEIQTHRTQPQQAAADDSEQGLDMLHVLGVLSARRLFIARGTLACIVLSVVGSLFMHNQYTAEIKIMAPQQRDSMASLIVGEMTGLGGLGGLKGLASSGLGFNDPNAPYIGLLQSTTVADRLIAQFDLKSVYKKKLMTDVRRSLEKSTDVSSTKDQGISIKVTDLDPERAAQIANAYVVELNRLSDSLSAGEAAQREGYFKKQLDSAEKQLSDAEVALRQAQEKTGLLDATSQARATFQEAAAIKAEIASEEANIGTMSSYETANNSDLAIARDRLATLKRELGKLKAGAEDPNDVMLPVKEIPEAALEYMRRLREVMHYEQVYKYLVLQYDSAVADRGRNALIVEVIDEAQPPEKKSKPHRALIVIFATFSGCVFFCLLALAKAGFESMARDSARAGQMAELRFQLLTRAGWKGFFSRRPKSGAQS